MSLDLVYNNSNFNKFNITDKDFNADAKNKHLQFFFFDKINELSKVNSVNHGTPKLLNEQMAKLDSKSNKLSNTEKK